MVRLAIVRCTAVAAVAILAAALGDAATESAQNAGLLGKCLHDNQHEALLPAFFLGAIIILALTLFLASARVAARDPLLLEMGNVLSRGIDLACAFCGSMACIVVMEGYETRFGGISPFDPRSVVLSHTLVLLVAIVLTGTIVYCALRAAIRVARNASTVVVAFIVEFLRRLLQIASASRATASDALDRRVTRVSLGIAGRCAGLRAPPPFVLFTYFAT